MTFAVSFPLPAFCKARSMHCYFILLKCQVALHGFYHFPNSVHTLSTDGMIKTYENEPKHVLQLSTF